MGAFREIFVGKDPRGSQDPSPERPVDMFVMPQERQGGTDGFIRGKVEISFCPGTAECGEYVGVVVKRDGVTAPSGPPYMTCPRNQHMVMLFHEHQRRSAKRQFPQDHSQRSPFSRVRREARCCLRR